MKRLLLALSLVLMLVACDQNGKLDRGIENVVMELKDSIDQIRREIDDSDSPGEALPGVALKEVEKLHQWEYKVIEFPGGLGVPEWEVELQRLGEERWECFHLEKSADRLAVFCKRRPKSYLRYIPRGF